MQKNIIKKEVFKASIKKPLTIFPLLIGSFSLVYFIVSGSSTVLSIMMVTGLSLGFFSFLYQYFIKRQNLTTIYLSDLDRQVELKNKKDLRKLKRRLRSSKFEEDVRFYSEQVYEQFEQLEEKFKNYMSIINEKFNPNELTYKRYGEVGEQLYLSLLDHLKKVSFMLESANAIDSDYIENKIKTTENEIELIALEERNRIKKSQFAEIARMIQLNEQGLTKLDATTNALAIITTKHGESNQDLDQILMQLEQLANSATKYNIK